jgi:hypothetical protein
MTMRRMRRQVLAVAASTAMFLGMAGPAAAPLETPAGDFGGSEPDTLPSGRVVEDIEDPSAPTRVDFGLAEAEDNPNTPIDCEPGGNFPRHAAFLQRAGRWTSGRGVGIGRVRLSWSDALEAAPDLASELLK